MTCPHCASGVPRVYGEHLLATERGVQNLGACSAPEELGPGPAPSRFSERLAGWRDRVRAMGKHIDEPKPIPVPFNEQAERKET